MQLVLQNIATNWRNLWKIHHSFQIIQSVFQCWMACGSGWMWLKAHEIGIRQKGDQFDFWWKMCTFHFFSRVLHWMYLWMMINICNLMKQQCRNERLLFLLYIILWKAIRFIPSSSIRQFIWIVEKI